MKHGTFIDTVYILALLNPRDQWHRKAIQLSKIHRAPLLTSHAVLTEVADALAHHSQRAWACQAIEDLKADPDVQCVSVDSAIFAGAVRLYRERPDKDWSLTDCISFYIMRQEKVPEALTADVHFEQAGFRALMRG